MGINSGRGSTGRQGPKKAFQATKSNALKKLDFGESSIGSGDVYRRRGIEKKSWFWIAIKLLVLGFILFLMIKVFIE